MSEYVLDRFPDNMSSRTSRMQDKMSNQMSESQKSIPDITDKTWDHMLEYMSDRASQYVPDRMSYRREECAYIYIYTFIYIYIYIYIHTHAIRC